MVVDTKKVTGRREVHYETLDDLLADAERMAHSNAKTLGNWNAGQIFDHIAKSFDSSIDGFDFSVSAPARWILKLAMKKRFLTKTLPAGLKTDPDYVPGEISTEQGLDHLRQSINRLKEETARVAHPGFGNISRDEWNQFHLRHAEMHMSFLAA